MSPLQQVPEVVDGYVIDQCYEKGFFSIVIPEETTNLCIDPSFDQDNGSISATWTAVNSTLTQSATQVRRGRRSCRIEPTNANEAGMYCTLTTGIGPYSFSLDLFGHSGDEYEIYITTNAGAALSQRERIKGYAEWSRFSVSWPDPTGAARRFYITRVGGGSTNYFYVDGVQIEEKAYPTDYCDGDMGTGLPQLSFELNDPPYYFWGGPPQGSISTRTNQVLWAGKHQSLRDLGFYLMSITGLGLNPPDIKTNRLSSGYGFFQDIKENIRTFSITGSLFGGNLEDLLSKRQSLISTLSPYQKTDGAPLCLLYHPYRPDGTVRDPLRLYVVYKGGLEGNITNINQDRVSIQFEMADPYLYEEGNANISLPLSTSLANIHGIFSKDRNGVFSDLAGGLGQGAVLCIKRNPVDGKIYVCGNFHTGVGAPVDYVGRWDPITLAWEALAGVGVNQSANWLEIDANGNVFICGTFTTAGGVACEGLARYNLALDTFSNIGNLRVGANPAIGVHLDLDSAGSLWIVGGFTSAGGVAANYLAKRTAAGVWSAPANLSAATANWIEATGIYVYVGGSFVTCGGVTCNGAARITISSGTVSAMGSGFPAGPGVVNCIQPFPDGSVAMLGYYVEYRLPDTATYEGQGLWIGSEFISLGRQQGTISRSLYSRYAEPGAFYVGGAFSLLGPEDLPTDNLGYRLGNQWFSTADDFSGVSPDAVSAIEEAPDGTLYIGTSNARVGPLTHATPTTVTVRGDSPLLYKFRTHGPGQVRGLLNKTNRRRIGFTTLILLDSEILIVAPFIPSERRKGLAHTDFRGDCSRYFSPGSDSHFDLLPGMNLLSVLITGTTDADTHSDLLYLPRYWSIEGYS